MFPYQRFIAWQVSHQLVQEVYLLTARWPKSELYSLVSQSRRSAFSIAANIVEGSAKKGGKEFRRFLDISLGSLAELSYCLLLARDLKYVSDEEWKAIEELRNRAGQLVWKLQQSVTEHLHD